MHNLQLLVQKFWEGSISEEEMKILSDSLSSNEQSIEAWLQPAYEQDVANGTKALSTHRSLEIWGLIQSKTNPAEQHAAPEAKIIRMTKRRVWQFAIAASVIGLLAAGIWLFKANENASGYGAIAGGTKQVLKTISNTGARATSTVLADSSVVVLSPGTSLSYYDPFDSLARNISMTGEANFTVAKNAAKPFTVFAAGIATTAIGTQFTVNTLQAGSVEVKLFKGKVVVRDVNRAFNMKDVYLNPGQRFCLNKNKQTVTVTNFAGDTAGGTAHNEPGKTPPIEGLSFKQSPLPDIFKTLEQHYHVKIAYKTSELKKITFTGRFTDFDSVDTILDNIAVLNSLTVTHTANGYTIKK